jgi:hypothetical protein
MDGIDYKGAGSERTTLSGRGARMSTKIKPYFYDEMAKVRRERIGQYSVEKAGIVDDETITCLALKDAVLAEMKKLFAEEQEYKRRMSEISDSYCRELIKNYNPELTLEMKALINILSRMLCEK